MIKRVLILAAIGWTIIIIGCAYNMGVSHAYRECAVLIRG